MLRSPVVSYRGALLVLSCRIDGWHNFANPKEKWSLERLRSLQAKGAPAEPMNCSSKKMREAVSVRHFRSHRADNHLAQKGTEVLVVIMVAAAGMSSGTTLMAHLLTVRGLLRQSYEMDAPQHKAASGSCCCIVPRRSRSLERFAEDRMETLVGIEHSMRGLHELKIVVSVLEKVS